MWVSHIYIYSLYSYIFHLWVWPTLNWEKLCVCVCVQNSKLVQFLTCNYSLYDAIWLLLVNHSHYIKYCRWPNVKSMGNYAQVIYKCFPVYISDLTIPRFWCLCVSWNWSPVMPRDNCISTLGHGGCDTWVSECSFPGLRYLTAPVLEV